jgi:hypothetical protein
MNLQAAHLDECIDLLATVQQAQKFRASTRIKREIDQTGRLVARLRITRVVVLHSRKRYSRSVKHGRHLRGFFSLFVICVWIATASFAEHVSAQFPLCQPSQSPCCPLPANNSSESCPACHVTVTVAEEQTREQEQSDPLPQAQNAGGQRPNSPVVASRRELTPGLRYRAAVFDLKADLRI